MNKELIKNNMEAFKHWLNGGKLLSKWPGDTEWQTFTLSTWNPLKPEGVLIVIDDEYSKLRCAKAEGKIIQFCNINLSKPYWIDWTDDPFKEDLNRLRIKPGKPSFKLGDWITNGTHNIQFNEDHEGYGVHESYKLWKPKPNEWCVFWETTEQQEYSLHVEQYIGTNEHGHYITKYTTSWLNARPLEYLQLLKKKKYECK